LALLCCRTKQVLAVDKQKYTMRVQGGITYTDFLKEATKAGMSVVVSGGRHGFRGLLTLVGFRD